LTGGVIAADNPPHHISLIAGSMIAFLSRFVGLWLIAGALVALVIDATRTIASSSLTMTPLGLAWANLSQSSLMSAQEFVQQRVEAYIGHWLWDPVIQSILLLPSWVVLGAAGFLLTWLGRPRRLTPAYG
jgi:hypothetical protein